MSRMNPRKGCWAAAALCSALVSASPLPAADAIAPAGSGPSFSGLFTEGVEFRSTLDGADELPPTHSAATGTAAGTLTGTPGRYVFTLNLLYTGLHTDALDVHIHEAVSPAGIDPRLQEGPIVFIPPASARSDGEVNTVWRWDDRTFPLTDSLVDSLFDGELYLNIHTTEEPDDEIRGQIEKSDPPVITPPTSVPAVPLPAPLALGAVGLGLAGIAVRRRAAVLG